MTIVVSAEMLLTVVQGAHGRCMLWAEQSPTTTTCMCTQLLYSLHTQHTQ